MSELRNIEKKWISNFKKSPLVDRSNMSFKKNIAHQLFYGKQDESYPEEYPQNYNLFYSEFIDLENDTAIDTIIEFLHFIGITIQKNKIINHINKFPEDYFKIAKKTYYILKAFAHYNNDFNISSPYFDNNGDLYFLLRIESEESIYGGQLNLFEDIELPELYSKIVKLPPNYENDHTIVDLFNKIENSNESFFITGKAGTGKSTFIHYFSQKTKKNILLTAFTGIAAINCGGQTIHSFFRFPLKPLLPEDHEITIFRNFTQKYKLIEKVDTIVIDEVSMLRSDILEAIDFSLRNNGGLPNELFGGKQIIFVGDVFQLPPVTNSTDEVENFLFKDVYKSEYFFDSKAYKNLSPIYFEFRKAHRQNEDIEFVKLLDNVRICKVDDLTLNKLNERHNPSYIPKNDEFVISLTTNNAIANNENNKKLEELNHVKYIFKAEIQGDFKEDKYPTSNILELKKNAQVILIKNDQARRWVNGTIAKIDFIANDLIEIKLQDGSIHKIEKEIWENRKYKYDKVKKKIVSEVIGSFTQYPIKLAWAITIHKSQGLTFDKVIVDLGTGAFVNGQLYTALSRCRKLNGITLRRKITKSDIITDQRIINFHASEQLIQSLINAKSES